MPGDNDPGDELRAEIRAAFEDADQWLHTPHHLLGGETPEERLSVGDYESVRHLFDLIVHIGIS